MFALQTVLKGVGITAQSALGDNQRSVLLQKGGG